MDWPVPGSALPSTSLNEVQPSARSHQARIFSWLEPVRRVIFVSTPLPCDFALYCERNLVERFFSKLKHFRAIATRYDKLARNFLAGVHLASAMILLNCGQALG
jgi:hypothetical protein